MDIAALLAPGAVALGVHADTKAKALAQVAEVASRALGQRSADVLNALLDREATGTTGVGHGVALPHGRVEGLASVSAVFVRLDEPVDYDSLDGRPVDLMLALLAPGGEGAAHLRVLARVSRVLRTPRLPDLLRQARTRDAVLALLSREPTSSAA